MDENEMFDSSIRSAGDIAGVFEFDGEAGYFYLYKIDGTDGQKVVSAIPIVSGTPDFVQDDIAVRWDAVEEIVGLFVRQELWAAFDVRTGAKYGGNWRSGAHPSIPLHVLTVFGSGSKST